jgi:hypothetical protein
VHGQGVAGQLSALNTLTIPVGDGDLAGYGFQQMQQQQWKWSTINQLPPIYLWGQDDFYRFLMGIGIKMSHIIFERQSIAENHHFITKKQSLV